MSRPDLQTDLVDKIEAMIAANKACIHAPDETPATYEYWSGRETGLRDWLRELKAAIEESK